MSAARTPEERRRAQPRAPRSVPPLVQLGCLHLVGILVVAGILLLGNTLAVTIAYQSWLEVRTGQRVDPRLAQAVLIVGPLVLMFFQYWLFDLIRDRLRRS
jgi:hypothetical protein